METLRLRADERARVGIDDSLVRLSIGLEDTAELADDIHRALTHV